MIEAHLYGKLRKHASEPRASGESILRLEYHAGETIRSLLKRAGLPREEIYHVFLNGQLVTTQNTMGPWLKYQEAGDLGLDTQVHEGDRLGLFAKDMGLLVV